MPDHEQVYAGETRRYDDMISREDPDGAIPGALEAIVDPAGLDVVDVGAGTGRLARLLAPKAKSVVLVDRSGEMLKTAAAKLHEAGHRNWTIRVADQRSLPLPDLSADLVVSGWSICYVASSNQPDHRSNLAAVMREIGRVLRPGGTAVIFETLGTGFSEPSPPDSLADYFMLLEGGVRVRTTLDPHGLPVRVFGGSPGLERVLFRRRDARRPEGGRRDGPAGVHRRLVARVSIKGVSTKGRKRARARKSSSHA